MCNWEVYGVREISLRGIFPCLELTTFWSVHGINDFVWACKLLWNFFSDFECGFNLWQVRMLVKSSVTDVSESFGYILEFFIEMFVVLFGCPGNLWISDPNGLKQISVSIQILSKNFESHERSAYSLYYVSIFFCSGHVGSISISISEMSITDSVLYRPEHNKKHV